MDCRQEEIPLFDFSHTLAAPLMESVSFPWEALPLLGDWIRETGPSLSPEVFEEIAPLVWAARSAVISPTAEIIGPAIIGERAEIRHGAFLRGNVLVGDDAVVGNSTECKNAILFDKVQLPHYNYAGDSVLGYGAHLGAGAVLSNVRADKKPVVVHLPGEDIPTGMKKLGAMVGDGAEVGCHAVCNPGVILGKGAVIYPLSMVRGLVPAGMIYKRQGELAEKQ